MSFTRAELNAARNHTIDDLIPDDMRLLFVGINPGLWTTAAQAHFARPGNRFYPALHRAGITPRLIDPSQGYSAADRQLLVDLGIGHTNLVARTTARADELVSSELVEGGQRLVRLVGRHRPAVVAVAAITAYRTAFARRDAKAGEQPELMAGARLFLVPNPSGLNAHETIDTLAQKYRAAAAAAGILPD